MNDSEQEMAPPNIRDSSNSDTPQSEFDMQRRSERAEVLINDGVADRFT